MYNHVCCFERKLHRWLLKGNMYRTFWGAFVARRVGLAQTAPNIGLHCSWRNRRKSVLWSIAHHTRARSLAIFEMQSSWIGLHENATWIVLPRQRAAWQLSLLWRWHHCLTACICARGCSVGWSTVSVTPTWPSVLRSLRSTCRHYCASTKNSHRHRFWCTYESEAISPVTLNIAAAYMYVRSVDSILFNTPCSTYLVHLY